MRTTDVFSFLPIHNSTQLSMTETTLQIWHLIYFLLIYLQNKKNLYLLNSYQNSEISFKICSKMHLLLFFCLTSPKKLTQIRRVSCYDEPWAWIYNVAFHHVLWALNMDFYCGLPPRTMCPEHGFLLWPFATYFRLFRVNEIPTVIYRQMNLIRITLQRCISFPTIRHDRSPR